MTSLEEKQLQVSIVIPTYGREDVLVDTIQALLKLESPADQILIIDQTPRHTAETQAKLTEWHQVGLIEWLRQSEPSITKAMNCGLKNAIHPLVLFLDDDIELTSELVAVHRTAHSENSKLWATVGQVVQPWQVSEFLTPPRRSSGLRADFDFPFNSTIENVPVENAMAGNLCVKRKLALALGGFDENFLGTAFRFETEFAKRIIKAGGRIHFLGSAGIRHLRAQAGGTRSWGDLHKSSSPLVGCGDYYFAMVHGKRIEIIFYCLRSYFRMVTTKFHFMHPWWIPAKLTGETRAILLAKRLYRSGPKYL